MNIDVLHRRVLEDVGCIYPALQDILPAIMPRAYVQHKVNVSAFVKRLNRITQPLEIHNYVLRTERVPKETVKFTGLWLPESELPWKRSRADVRIEWNLHPTSNRLAFTYKSWRQFRFGYWGYLMHELVHRHQNIQQEIRNVRDTRSFRPESAVDSIREEQEYLGSYDEIEAYAHDVAVEMVLLSPSTSFTKALSVMQQQSIECATSYNVFTQSFANVPEHPAMKVFMRKVHEWFDLVKSQQSFYCLLELEASWIA